MDPILPFFAYLYKNFFTLFYREDFHFFVEAERLPLTVFELAVLDAVAYRAGCLLWCADELL